MADQWLNTEDHAAPKANAGGWQNTDDHATSTSKPRGQVFWETIGGQALQDMIGGASRDPEKAKKALDTFKGLVHGIADEPARVWDQLSKSGEAMTRGDIPAAASHLGGAVPFIGGTAREVQHDVEKGNYGDALERTAGLVLPLAVPKIPAMAKAAAPAVDATGAALKGAAKGAYSEATTMVPKSHYIPVSVPKAAVTASLGATAFRAVGLPHEAGAVLGATVPIVRAAYKGGREALRERLLIPAAPPPGFGIAEGSTAPTLANLSPATPTAQLVNQPTSQFQPPVGGVFPGTEVPGVAPPEVASPAPGFGVASGSTASPIAVTPPPTPGYQPPVSGALPSVAPEAAPGWASMPVEPPSTHAVADTGGLAAERASSPAGPSPEMLDQIARSQAGKRFNRLFPQEQEIVRRIAERMSQPTAAMASETPQSLAAPPEVAPQQATSAPPPGNSAEIAAALRDEMVRSGTIAPEAAQPVGGAPDPTGLADLMRELPQGTKKEVAKSNYRAVKEGASSPETAGPTYEAAGRATKVDPVVKAILDHGFTYSDIIRLTKTQIKDLADKLSKATAAEGGQHPGHAFSALSVDEMIGQLRMAEDAAKRAARPASK